MEPIRVLFLAANPTDLTRLKLDQEFNEINRAIRSAEHRDRINVIAHPATTASDLQQALLQHRPHIVHFSGHGSENDEILLMGEHDLSHAVEAKALQDLFAVLKNDVRVVVLNACYSRTQARAITKEIDCVIGMASAITDNAAIAFSKAFYRALGYAKSVQEAFDLGKNQLDLSIRSERETPKLLLRVGVSADDIDLIGSTPAPAQDATAPRPASVDEVHVDREQEKVVFERMLALEEEVHVLLLIAPGGMGKTALIGELWRASPAQRRARVKLKSATSMPEDVLDDLVKQLGPDSFPRFVAQRHDAGSATLSAPNTGESVTAGAFAAPMSGRGDARKEVTRQCTAAFFSDAADLVQGEDPLVLLLDGFDRADDEIAGWLQDEFLEEVFRHPGIVTVVAGRIAPVVSWDDACVKSTLANLSMNHIRDWTSGLKLNLHPAQIESLYIESDGGNPFAVRNLIEKHVHHARREQSNG